MSVDGGEMPPNDAQVHHLAAFWVDNAGLTRCRVLPRNRVPVSGTSGVSVTLTSAIQSMPCMYDSPLTTPVGTAQLTLSSEAVASAAPLAWMPGAGACFGDMLRAGKAWSHCPRSFLRSQARQLLEEHKLRATVGFELEFTLLRGHHTSDMTPVDSTLYCEARAFHDPSSWGLLQRIVRCLDEELDIPVQQFHAESGSGQFEISIGPFNTSPDCDPVEATVEAVDKLVLTRQCVYGLAAQMGWQATFVPKLRKLEAGNAAHTHLGLLSIDDGTNLLANTSAKTQAQSFVAGILDQLPAMCVLLAGCYNSYERLQPRCWAGAFQCYGFENKEAPIRLVTDANAVSESQDDWDTVQHLEVKTGDATANPYVALGALLAAGMHGMRRELSLPPPCDQDPAMMAEAQRPPALPRSLNQAIEAMRKRKSLWQEILTPSYFDLMLAMREAENSHYSVLDRDEMLRQLVQRY